MNKTKVEAFNIAAGFKAVGLDIAGWNGGEDLGKAVKIVMEGNHSKIAKDLEWLSGILERQLKDIKESIAQYTKLQEIRQQQLCVK